MSGAEPPAPRRFADPQQYALPEAIPHVPLKVVLNASNESPPLTATGTAARVSPPFPILPKTPEPQHIATLESVTAHVPFTLPIETDPKVPLPDIGAGIVTFGGFPEAPFPS